MQVKFCFPPPTLITDFVCTGKCRYTLHAGAIPLTTAYFERGNATILVRDFRCTGREQSLHECRPRNYSISSYYSRGYNVPNRYVQSAQHFLLHMILLASFPGPAQLSIVCSYSVLCTRHYQRDLRLRETWRRLTYYSIDRVYVQKYFKEYGNAQNK